MGNEKKKDSYKSESAQNRKLSELVGITGPWHGYKITRIERVKDGWVVYFEE